MSRSARLVPAATAGLALLATLLVVAPPGQASRTVSEAYTVPASGKLALTGHGFGHGHGMSQYGAQGAALKGLTYQQILAFYYPGTALGNATGSIRVLITADTDNDVRVVPASGLAVRQAGSATSYAVPTNVGATTWRLVASGSNTVVQYANGGWKSWKTLAGDAEFFGPASLTLRVAGTTRAYRGALRLSNSNTVNVLGLDAYVQGVIPREMPTSWQPAAVRAQAVAARTYGVFDRNAHPTRYYDTCDTTSCQVYGGIGDEDSRGNAAATATAGKILRYSGQPAFTQFASSNGGWMSAGGQPYLVSKADPYDGFNGNPMHTWTTSLTQGAVQKAYPSLGTLKRVLVTRRDGNGDWYGRVEQLKLDGSKADVTLSGDAFRSKFGLRSSWFRFGSGSSAPVPTPAPDAQATPIHRRWLAIGGASSVVGAQKGAEYAVAGGRAQRFAKGRIFYKAGLGAHEEFGRVLTVYVRRGAATSKLGFPLTRPQRAGKRVKARFEHGTISVRRHGKPRAIVTFTS
ncbi:SpoIID/LytB domain-containing protein [Marmoricola sp. URHB0036]|uniref:SpoIID/LytB domain-containing protein n=1 Tax=Marmoricola sp. URHB0036 TaxID=1298863 RepID=UPI00040365A1|nr:SpoIID/LytB domain-containing protein [Marmoricola sp. URHB0036]